MSIVAIESVIILLIVPVLIVSVAMPFTPRGRSGAMSRLDSIRRHGPAMNPVPRLRHSRILISCCPE